MSFEHYEQRAHEPNAQQFEYYIETDAQVVDTDAQILEDEPLEDADVISEEDAQIVPDIEAETDEYLAPDTESDLLSRRAPSLLGKETLLTLARQLSPLLVPLPFAALVFLFTLPATLQGPPAHPSPLIMGILLVALAILQGTLLYFAGENDTLWLLSTIGGYALFVTLGIGAVFGLNSALFVLVMLAILGFLPLRRGIHPTSEGYVDVVESFGKYAHTLYPGLNLLMPWENVARRLNIQETTWACPEQRVPLSRDQLVRLTATISYQLVPEDAHLAHLSSRDWESSLRALFVGTLQSVINAQTPAEFVSWSQSGYMHPSNAPGAATRWDHINARLCRLVQDQVAAWGAQINWVRIQEPIILPHAQGEPTILIENAATQLSARTASGEAAPAPPRRLEVQPVSVPVSDVKSPMPRMPANKMLRLETLVDAYNAVRQGTITDPATILEIAQRFEQLDNDPTVSSAIEFDASRAAQTLRQRAQKLKERARLATLNTRREGPG